MKERKDFVRIAMARLKKIYKNPQQRLAWAAKMYANWKARKDEKGSTHT